ncbi:hypothetical protein F5887DRAFT_922490 [Amanita rubescens]|nr:hypothetical protein F5887DRAFT_922490 [Amanita rubescens]
MDLNRHTAAGAVILSAISLRWGERGGRMREGSLRRSHPGSSGVNGEDPSLLKIRHYGRTRTALQFNQVLPLNLVPGLKMQYPIDTQIVVLLRSGGTQSGLRRMYQGYYVRQSQLGHRQTGMAAYTFYSITGAGSRTSIKLFVFKLLSLGATSFDLALLRLDSILMARKPTKHPSSGCEDGGASQLGVKKKGLTTGSTLGRRDVESLPGCPALKFNAQTVTREVLRGLQPHQRAVTNAQAGPKTMTSGGTVAKMRHVVTNSSSPVLKLKRLAPSSPTGTDVAKAASSKTGNWRPSTGENGDAKTNSSESGTAEPAPQSEMSSNDSANLGPEEERQPGVALDSGSKDDFMHTKVLQVVGAQNGRALNGLAEILTIAGTGNSEAACYYFSQFGRQDTDTEEEDSTSVTQQSPPQNRLRRTYAVEDLSKVFTEASTHAAPDSHEPPTGGKSDGDKLN